MSDTDRPLTIRWAPPPRAGRTLFIVCAYHGRDHDAEVRGLLERWESTSARGHRIVHRDHYANPRSLPYLVGMVSQVASGLGSAQSPDLVLDRQFGSEVPEGVTAGFGRVETAAVVDPAAWRQGLLADVRGYANVVIVYADALGLGCDVVDERCLSSRAPVFVVNGRRRAFVLDRPFQRRLRVHRWLAATRIVERALAVAVRPLASTLAAWDRLRAPAA